MVCSNCADLQGTCSGYQGANAATTVPSKLRRLSATGDQLGGLGKIKNPNQAPFVVYRNRSPFILQDLKFGGAFHYYRLCNKEKNKQNPVFSS